MLTIESKTVLVQGNQEAVYQYISDFNNFSHLLPSDKMSNLKIESDSMSFSMDGLGTVGLMITEKKPFSQIRIDTTENTSTRVTLWCNMAVAPGQCTHVNLSLQANLNMFLEMVAKGPLQQFVDLIADKLSQLKFDNSVS